VRAREWSPALGAFLQADELEYRDNSTTLWGWAGQSPALLADARGHDPPGYECAKCGTEYDKNVQQCFKFPEGSDEEVKCINYFQIQWFDCRDKWCKSPTPPPAPPPPPPRPGKMCE
jgi:hypothetical protein